MLQNNQQIYQAPLQGFTDFTFRTVVAGIFGGIDKFFVPYLSYGKGREIKKSQLRQVFPEHNSGLKVVPQVLFSDEAELQSLTEILTGFGYPEINLNLGCPYPMATNRGRGAAWLEKPGELSRILEKHFAGNPSVRFSVKMRAGMTSDRDAATVFDVLNSFPLEEVIFHPRTASQMYDGYADPDRFAEALQLVKHPLVYNGDIVSLSSFQELTNRFPEQSRWMIGRGLLMNPALAVQIRGDSVSANERWTRLQEFHHKIVEAYAARLDGPGHLLAKMNQFWTYFSESFSDPHKVRKLVKKAGNLNKYNAAVAEIFKNYGKIDLLKD